MATNRGISHRQKPTLQTLRKSQIDPSDHHLPPRSEHSLRRGHPSGLEPRFGQTASEDSAVRFSGLGSYMKCEEIPNLFFYVYICANAESPTQGRTCGRSAFLLTLSSLRSLRNMTCIAICWMAHGSRSDFTLLKILSKLK